MAITGTDGIWTTGTWPWPQVIFQEFYTLAFALELGTSLHLYELYCDTSDVWQGTEIQDLGDETNIKYVTAADFNQFYVVTTFADTGHVVTVASYIKDPSFDTVTTLPSDEAPLFGCVENFNGQAVIGCITRGTDDNFHDMTNSTVAWSEVGKFDFRLGEVDVTGGSKKFNRTAGYRNMPWGERGRGIVYRVKKLGNKIMVYGDGGVALLSPVSQPFSSYSLDHVNGDGIIQGSAVDGDENIHFWIDHKSKLWVCGSDFKPQKLGYKEFLEDLSGIIKLSYCSARKRLFISDGSSGYVLTEHGLYSTDQYCSSVGAYRGTLCGFFVDGDDKEIRLTTDTLDFGQRGLKTLEALEFGANYYNSSGDILQSRVDWRSDYQSNRDSFNAGTYARLSPKGIVYPVTTANEFRIKLKGATYVDSVANLDYINMRAKLVDKHSVRGLYKTSE